jgi:hypothetical protein
MGAAGPVELFFVAALTDAIGGEAISKRIREQLQEHVHRAGLTLSVSYKAVARTTRNSNQSTGEYLEQVAAGIQELINVEISSRVVVNG